MPSKILGLNLTTRIVLATALLASGTTTLAARLFPHASVATAFFYTAAAGCALLGALVCATVVSLTFRQFILRKGGTDAQWFWFF